MTTPAGITGLWNPAYLVGTYLMMREDQEMHPLADLTKLGQAVADRVRQQPDAQPATGRSDLCPRCGWSGLQCARRSRYG